MTIGIRALAHADIEAVVGLSLRAWAPVFASFETVLGEDIYRRIYPDWLSSQARDVTKVCTEHAPTTWVATVGDEPVGFVALVLNDADRSSEIEMLAVDPAHQRKGIAERLSRTPWSGRERRERSWWRSAPVVTRATHRPAARTRRPASPRCPRSGTTGRSDGGGVTVGG